ncbi:anti-sigma factor family protein [Streptomyces sp. NPDC002640]
MTSTKDTAGHPDVTEISELVEGVLAPDRTVSVREHLDDCALCADVLAALEEIRCSLGTLPGPVRMPADVAGRIDAALAAEALLSASGNGTATAPAPTVGTARTSATHPRRRPTDVSRETSPPSPAPVPGGRSGGAAGSPPARRTGPTGPGRDGRSSTRPGAARRRTLTLGAVLAAAALGIGVLLTQPFQEDPAPPTAASFSGRPLDQQVTGLLAEAGRSEESSSPQPRTMIRPAVEVPSCIRSGIARTEDAIAAEKGRYDGKDAYLVLLPDPKADSRVTAYVVDASCIRESSAGKETKGDVLLKRSYARSSS